MVRWMPFYLWVMVERYMLQSRTGVFDSALSPLHFTHDIVCLYSRYVELDKVGHVFWHQSQSVVDVIFEFLAAQDALKSKL